MDRGGFDAKKCQVYPEITAEGETGAPTIPLYPFLTKKKQHSIVEQAYSISDKDIGCNVYEC